MKTFIEITITEFKLFTRNFINMFFLLIFPMMLLLMFGGIYGNEPSEMFNGHGTIDVSVPAYMGMVIAVSGIMSLPLVTSSYRERKILKRFRATPMNPLHVIISQVMVNFIMTAVGIILLIIVGKLVFNLQFFGNVLLMIGMFLLAIISIFSLGFLIASIAPNMRSANAIANLVYFPMLFLTGATIPMELMPDTMVKISKVIPLTYVVNGFKKVWMGGTINDILVEIIVLVAITMVCVAISYKYFRWE